MYTYPLLCISIRLQFVHNLLQLVFCAISFGRGCKVCNGTDYKGRKGVFEYLRMSPPLRELVNNKAPTLIIREKARELGMRTMREDGIRSILDGYTTVDEVLRYT